MDANEKATILARVQECLTALGQERGVELRVEPEESSFEDEWLYVTVAAPEAKVRASEYSDVLAEAEKRVRHGLRWNLLLVPAMPCKAVPARGVRRPVSWASAPMTAADVEQIVDTVQQRLTELGRAHGVELRVDRKETQMDDGWLYVTLWSPTKGVRASDYAEMFSEVETQLRDEIKEHMLLIPAIP